MRLDSARDLKAQLGLQLHKIALGQKTTMLEMFSAAIDGKPRAAGRAPRRIVPQGVAVGITPAGRKRKKDGYRLAVRIQVRDPATAAFASYAAGMAKDEVDVRFVGPVAAIRKLTVASPYRARVRPVKPGYSIAHPQVTAGTIGMVVKDAKGRVGLLSNNHVLANSNNAARGDAALQPSPHDGGSDPVDAVGTLERFIRLKPTGSNSVDAAYARLSAEVAADPTFDGRVFAGLVAADDIVDNTEVWKIGRTTGFTEGVITAVEVDQVTVDYNGMLSTFDGQIEIAGIGGAFSAGGDSGSCILNGHNEGVGLLFAGSEEGGPDDTGLTYANPLEWALGMLSLTPA